CQSKPVIHCTAGGDQPPTDPRPPAQSRERSPWGVGAVNILGLSVGDGGQTGFAASVIDYLQHPLAVREILQPELLDQAGVVDKVVAGGLFSAGLVLESDLRVGQEPAHEVGQF